MDNSQPLLLDTAAHWFRQWIREFRAPLITSLVVGFLSYMFAFTNKLVNHDEVTCLFSKGGTVTSGRWGLGAMDSIFPNYSMPWIYGVITLVLIAVSASLLCSIFQIKKPVLQALLAGYVVAFPSLIGFYTYMFTASSYGVSFLLAAAAVWALQLEKKWTPLLAMACMVASLSIYQAYIALAASLLVLVLIRELLQGKAVSKVIKRGLWYLGFLIVSLGLYYLATQCVNLLMHIPLNGYASDRMQFSLSALPQNVLLAYQAFFRAFRSGSDLIPTALGRWMHILCLAASAVLIFLVALWQKKPRLGRCLLLAALLGLLPLSINCMYLFTTANAVHTLVLYGFVAVAALFLFLADLWLAKAPSHPFSLPGTLSANIVSIAMVIAIIGNIYVANEVFLNLHLRYENTYAFYTALMAKLQEEPTYSENTVLAVVGDLPSPDFYQEHFAQVYPIQGSAGIIPSVYSKDKFLEYYLGLSIPMASDAEIEAIRQSPQFAEMPCYPYSGSMKMIGDTFVVKLSD